MIDLDRNLIILNKKQYPIENFQVWWAIENIGLFTKLEEAQEFLNGQPLTGASIRPVSVAVSGEVYEPI